MSAVSGGPQGIASSGSDGCIKLWRRQPDDANTDGTLQETARLDMPKPSSDDLAHPRPPNALCLSTAAEGQLLRVGASSGTVLSYDLVSPQPLFAFTPPPNMNQVC